MKKGIIHLIISILMIIVSFSFLSKQEHNYIQGIIFGEGCVIFLWGLRELFAGINKLSQFSSIANEVKE